MTTPELKPCPFCGSEADIAHDHTVEENHAYGCRRCDLWFTTFNAHDAITAWNTRADIATAPDLSDSATVHANMLRGSIAKLTLDQVVHLYGIDAICRHLAPMIVREDSALVEAERDACAALVERIVAEAKKSMTPAQILLSRDEPKAVAEALTAIAAAIRNRGKS